MLDKVLVFTNTRDHPLKLRVLPPRHIVNTILIRHHTKKYWASNSHGLLEPFAKHTYIDIAPLKIDILASFPPKPYPRSPRRSPETFAMRSLLLLAVGLTVVLSLPEFDFYILATFWPAELCHSESINECKYPEPFWKTHFTGHGLWPNDNNGTWPSYCTKESLDR